MGTLKLVVALEFGGGIFLGAIDTTTTSNKRTERYRYCTHAVLRNLNMNQESCNVGFWVFR